MFPPLPQEISRQYLEECISALEGGLLKLERQTRESEERKGQGIMLGCLTAWNSEKKERVVLLAVSGISIALKTEKKQLPAKDFYKSPGQCFNAESFILNGTKFIIVPPLADEKSISAALLAHDKQIHILTEKINTLSSSDKKKQALEIERKKLTDESLAKVFSLYNFIRFDGKSVSLNQIIKNHNKKLPPTGTGDCCAPKLLSFAFKNGLKPVSMDEIFYGKNTPHKISMKSYPPCDERCGYILPEILGLEILYRDSQIIVINKKSGLLSVPGRGSDKQDCVVNRLKTLFPFSFQINQPAVHRLDMETSGLLVLAFTAQAHKNLSLQFEKSIVHKEYEALLDGILELAEGLSAPKKKEQNGMVRLKFRLDPDNRPHQIYDDAYGKEGITEWKKIRSETFFNPITGSRKKATRITFIPHTGRTHQLRLLSSDVHGFALPIIGDSLYGKVEEGERLMLHAKLLEFYHPVSGEKMTFYSPAPF